MKNPTNIGTIVSQNNPQVASLLAGLGFDFIFIDLEHGSLSDQTIATIILSKKKCKVFIRVRAITEAHLKHALDLGCDGIIAPRVETLEELKILVDYSQFPPQGKRSVGFSLANQFGLKFKEYNQNFKPIIFAQIESTQGLTMADQIISNEFIDGIFLGPYDLSMSMNLSGDFQHPTFKQAINSIQVSCKKHNKLLGTFLANAERAKKEIEAGYDLLAIGVDSHIQLMAYKNIIQSVR
jgi:2-keto-3-deoxy-L-rhamnonate aldolase RhmA